MKITENGVVVAGKEYALDCIIYASGFEVGTEYKRRSGFDLTGRDGRRLSEHWASGMRTKHGIHVHGFPNAFFVQPTQGANLISNVPHNLTEAARTIALMVNHAQANGFVQIEVTREAEDRWVELLLTGAGRMIGSQDCTPGYYNNEGREPGPAAKLHVGHPAGALAYFKYIDAWREQRPVRGTDLSLRRPSEEFTKGVHAYDPGRGRCRNPQGNAKGRLRLGDRAACGDTARRCRSRTRATSTRPRAASSAASRTRKLPRRRAGWSGASSPMRS